LVYCSELEFKGISNTVPLENLRDSVCDNDGGYPLMGLSILSLCLTSINFGLPLV